METFGVLVNICHGGFGFSEEFAKEFQNRTGIEMKWSYRYQDYRDHPEAIKLFNEKGSDWSSETYSKLELQELPILFKKYWTIQEYDGMEHIVVNVHKAIADLTFVYLENPTPETLEILKKEVTELKSYI